MENTKFAEKVRQRLTQLRMSQSELARLTETTRQAIQGILDRGTPPLAPTLLRIARVLRVTVDYLIDDAIETEATDVRFERISEDESRLLYYARILGQELAERRLIGAPETSEEGKWDRSWGGDPVPPGEETGEEPKQSKPGPA